MAVSRAASGGGFSIQAWGLREKVLEVDALVAAGEARLSEVHPEVSFARLAGRPAAYAKKTWAGQRERLALLAAAGLDLARLVGDVGLAAPDDVVDAGACAWTALRLVRGEADEPAGPAAGARRTGGPRPSGPDRPAARFGAGAQSRA